MPETFDPADPDRWCAALSAQLDPTQDLPFAVTEQILRLARDVAHGTTRRNAPVATFLAGRHLGMRAAQGVDTETALAEVTAAVDDLLNDADATR